MAGYCDTIHTHKCFDCNVIWRHNPDNFEDNREQFAKAHKCPKCGKEQRRIYDGEGDDNPDFCGWGETSKEEKLERQAKFYL